MLAWCLTGPRATTPSRGAFHREVVRAFPPGGLIKPTVRKAIAEAGASGAPLAQAGQGLSASR